MIPPSGNLQCSEDCRHSPLAALFALWHGATTHARPFSQATTRYRGTVIAGVVFVSRLHPDRLHAGERHSVPAADLSCGNRGIHACAPHASRRGKPLPFRELPVRQRSRRRTHIAIRRFSTAKSHRLPAAGYARTSSTGHTACASPSASRSSFSRLNRFTG
jgi:hypothetical protein